MNVKTFFKICISATLIGVILSRLNWDDFVQNVKSIKLEIYLIVFLLSFLAVSVNALRWKMLLKVKGITISLRQSLAFLLVGIFFGIFLPTSLGGDIARMYDFSKYSSKVADTISSIFIERWSGVLALACIAMMDLAIYYHNISYQIRALVIGFFSIVITVTFIIFHSTLYEKLFRLYNPRSNLFITLKKKLEVLFLSIQEYRKHKLLLANTFLLAVVINILRVAINFANSRAVALDISFSYFLLFIPLIILVMMVPISIAGIGVRESAFLYFFSQVGMSSSDAVLLSWMGFVLVICQAIAGGLIFGLRKHSFGKDATDTA